MNALEAALLEAIRHARAYRLREEALSLALTLECVRRSNDSFKPAGIAAPCRDPAPAQWAGL